uniref:Cytoplasmic dynein 2 heavy chain 1 n=2 Tax=Hemiselmis TaxID=77924 RepID=A0A7S0W0F2_9CRYP
MAELAAEDWMAIRERLYVIEDCLAKWGEALKGLDIDVVVRFLHSEIERLKKNVPYLKFVKGDAFTQEHWNQLFRMLNMPKGIAKKDLTLQHFLDASNLVVEKMEAIKDLQARATAELTIQEAFDELTKWKQEAVFNVIEQTDFQGRPITLIKEWKEVQTQVGDHQSVLQAMRDSPYFARFSEIAETWDVTLSTLGFALNDLNAVQRKWLYLEPIFGRGALPHEQGRFKSVDDEFKNIMSQVRMDSRVVALADISGLNDKLPVLINQLDRCQKALSDFLEEKRSRFPRFYFIGDDDLLEILGQSQNPAVIQSHLKKLFQAIFAVNFSEDMKEIVAFRSLEGEVVNLLQPVEITDTVEVWLADLAKAMVMTLEQSLVDCLQTMDLNEFPSMILCAAEQICFCKDAEKAIQKRSMKDFEASLRSKLAQFTSYPQEAGVLQLKLKAIILDVIHDIDMVNQLNENRVSDLQAWFWQKQLRYYNDNGKCTVRMCDAQNRYTYEYQGNDPKLVHTPLTDKCYLTLTQGLHLGYGGNPYGPAGTGKTESVKALGQALARQVLVFNCDEGIDFKSMGRIFTGLVKCGAWGCFDEFNRLEPEVLSAVSQQIQVIQAALKERKQTVDLLGKVIDVNPNSGIFVTLNPAGKGYGGRSELPDNLKQLFRSVAMAAPDNALIAEVILYAEGYVHAKTVGTKVVELFTLSKQLLSKQQHYDWGLRALKTILLISGKLIQMEKKAASVAVDIKVEMELVIKAVRLNTLAKLTNADMHRFEALIKDIFPGTEVKDAIYADLETAIKASLEELKLDPLPSQIKKVVQLNENLNQRMGCVIVGPSGCGKSSLLRILRAAHAKMKQQIVVHTMNPKAMPRQQLLGHMDLDTREWFDGVLTASARQVVKEPPEVRSWILCDGDIDPEWVESLNSVLDDNRLLTMPSGERIRFGPNVNFIFETNDLRFASPATVSRMGMIFLSDEDMQTGCLVRAWVSRQPQAQMERLTTWLDLAFDKALEWVLRVPHVVKTTKVGLVLNALSHLVGCEVKEEFACALARGMGSNLDLEQRAKLASEVFQWCSESPLQPGKPLDCYFGKEEKRLLDYKADLGTQLTPKDMVMNSPTERDLPVIKTVDLFKNFDLIGPWLDNNEPFLLVGPEGSGKSMLLRHAFSVKMKGVEVATINCNAQTSAIHVIQKLQQSCTVATAATGRVYRPKSEKLVLYLKDINLPKPDKYDTMQLIAFLQQLILFQGFYDGLEWMGIERVQIVCSMNPSTTVGRHQLTTRFTAIVRIASISYPAREQLQQVYSAYLQAVLRARMPTHQVWSDAKNMERLAGMLLDFFKQFGADYSVDEHRHYLVTPRDVTSLVVGLLRYDFDSVNVLEALTYEAQRIFRDRLVGQESSTRFDNQLNNLLRSEWKEKLDLSNGVFATWLHSSSDSDSDISPGGVKLLGKGTLDDLKGFVEDGKIKYEREFKELNMLLFPEIVDRIARLDRILSTPGGSALLVGRPGVGRRTCVTLACHMHGMEVFTPKVGRAYSSKHFLNDLKGAIQVAGVQGQPACLYIEDYQLVEPAFLEVINSLLSSGEIPGMFTSQELDALLMPLKEEFSKEGYKYRSPYAFFVNRVQMHLHIVISLDPSHPDFLIRCESNPALYTRCSIMWLEAWSKQGMSLVPQMLLKETLADVPEPEQLVESMQYLHSTCVKQGAAPRQYVTLLDTIGSLYKTKLSSLQQQRSFLGGGLRKLEEAAETVDTLSKEAVVQQKQLNEKKAQAEHALQEITSMKEDAGKKKQEAQDLSSKLAVAEASMEGKRVQVEAELSECQPVLDAARQAVGSIKKDNLTEIRSLKLPPEAIRDVLEGVLRLMNNQDTSWISMKRFLAQGSVINDILNFDARSITPEIREGVRKLLQSKAASFQHENIFRVSVAAAPMASWVKAQIQYSLVLEKIAPLEAELNNVNKSLDSSRKRIKECAEDIQQSDETVARLTKEFSTLTQEATRLEMGLQTAMQTLEAAQNLLGKLDEERERWGSQMTELDTQLKKLPINIIMASAFTTYLGEAPEDRRAQLVGAWCGHLQVQDSFKFMLMMSTESERLTWKAQGLPGDDLSAENAVIILNTKQYPLVIDPATQATEWLLTHHTSAGISVEVTTQQDAKFMQKLELAVRFGKTLVIQEVDKIEPLLFPILRKDLQRQGPRWCVAIGEKVLDFSEQFQLFMVTRNPAMEIAPDARPLVAQVNFSVTRSGLEGQLLGRTIQNEKPELERQKSELLKAEEEMKVRLSNLEKQLLEQLASSEGNILENKALIQALTDTKVSSQEIKQSLDNSHLVQAKLDNEREVYRNFARSSANVFFLIQALKSLNYMYQFDLPTYLHLFQSTLEASGTSEDVTQRLSILVTMLKRNIFNYVGRSLFKADRLTFGMHLVHGMNPEMFKDEEWEFFVGLVVANVSSSQVQIPDWVPADRRPALERLSATFPSLVMGLKLSQGGWEQWVQSPKPESRNEFPQNSSGLRPFQQMLVVQALRADRLQSAMEAFVTDGLGVATNLSTLNLGQVSSEVLPTTPIMFIVTPGADPSAILEQAADSSMGTGKYRQLAMGQGQADAALSMLREGAEEGHWVCLQNVHLVVSWLGVLEKELRSLKPAPTFRLWLTTEPHPRFPPILLQQSLKVTFEAPPGLKKNLQNAYSMWSPSFVGEGSASRAQLLFIVAWFHAVVQERRTFIPQGWSKFHEFSFADLRSTAAIISSSDTENPPWETLHGLLDNAIYGGRIDNVFDQRILRTCLQQYYSEAHTSTGGRQARPLPNTQIVVPSTNEHAKFLSLINKLPDVDVPALFGLPPNIERVVQQANSNRITAQLKTMATAAVASGGWDREKMAQQMKPLLDLWQTLTNGSSVLKPVKKGKAGSLPVDVFVAMEAESAHHLINTVHKMMSAIASVLRGSELLTSAVRDAAVSLAAGLVPPKWSDVWEGPESPALWLQAVVDKTSAIDRWLDSVQTGATLSAPLSLSSMFNPAVFLNALRQQTARQTNVAVDELKLVCQWGGNANVGALPVTINGTVLQGALFGGGLLGEARLDTPTVSPLPPCVIGYIPQSQEDPSPDATSVALPVYEGLDRSKLLTQLRMPCKNKDQDRWILAGCSIFISPE